MYGKTAIRDSEETQKAESVSSIKSFEDQEGRSIRDIEEEEEILENEIALLNKQLEKEESEVANREPPMRPPPQKNIFCHL